MKPLDGAACPNNASKCAAFYNPSLLPAGINSVSYCSQVLVGQGFGSPGYTMLTMPLTQQEQQSFLASAQTQQTIIKEKTPISVVMEVYKVAYLDTKGNNNVFFAGNEYWNPVCASDAYLPPFSQNSYNVVLDSNNGYDYSPALPDTYTGVVAALQSKNAQNDHPMSVINALPSSSTINMEWPNSVFAYSVDSNVDGYNLHNFLFAPSYYISIPAGAKPLTLCDSPAAMKMLGFGPSFNKNGHTIDDINSPAYNPYVTLSPTDGALVIPDVTNYPPPGLPTFTWDYNSADPAVVNAQLPKAYYEKSVNYLLPRMSCTNPGSCAFPQGVNTGRDLRAVFTHEINHVMGVMSSQYYKVPYEGTALTLPYARALYLLDLFDLDSDDISPVYAGFTAARRNNNGWGPNTILYGYGSLYPTPWIQWGYQDHLFTYENTPGTPQYFPLMNYSLGNPDGDIQEEAAYYDTWNNQWFRRSVFVDPLLANMPESNAVSLNPQAEAGISFLHTMTVREYSELSAQGWNVDYSTLTDPYSTVAPTWKWYQTCFDQNGVFTTAYNSNCKFSVTPDVLKFLQ